MWPGLVDWVRDSMLSFETPLINVQDVDIPVCVESVEQAIEIIRKHREEWAKNNRTSQPT
jgi:hypothetical protein